MNAIRLLLLLSGILLSVAGKQLNRICYYVKNQNLTADQIDPTICSHIIFESATIINYNLVPADPSDPKLYQQFLNLKKKEPNIKILIGIGASGASLSFVNSKLHREEFVNSTFSFMYKYGFDGLDIDWEFPGWDGPIDDRIGFRALLRDLFNKKRELYPKDNGPLITVAVSASLTIIAWSYNIPEMAKYVDFVNIMCYDYNFYRKYLPITGHNSPLFKHKDDVIFFNTWNIEWTANYWAKMGMPKSKILVGLPTYGHTFRLLNPDKTDLYDLVIGPGSGNGNIAYPEVCEVLRTGGVRVFDNESLVPYAYQGSNWISYEDVTSITLKAKWIVQQNFSGAMTWNLNSDDWAATCSDVKFPLHKALRDTLTVN